MFIIKKKYIYNIIMSDSEVQMSSFEDDLELHEALAANAEANSSDNLDVDLQEIGIATDLSDLIENYDELNNGKKEKKEVGMIEQMMNFVRDNCTYILIGILIIVVICSINKSNNLGHEYIDNMCGYLETSVGSSITSSINDQSGQNGGGVNDITSSLDSMSSTSGTN